LEASLDRRWAYSSAVMPGVTVHAIPGQNISSENQSPHNSQLEGAHTFSGLQDMRMGLMDWLAELELSSRNGVIRSMTSLSQRRKWELSGA
jgi:hypothetical protein